MCKNKQTAIIWNEINRIRYFVTDKNMDKFQKIYINSGHDYELEQELSTMVYDALGESIVSFISLDSFKKTIIDGANIVECGYIP